MKDKKIVYVTGCLGFIGYHVTKACLDQGWYVRGVDVGTYAANWNLLPELKKCNNFEFDHVNILDIDMLFDCDYVINTAAETHVDNSIISNRVFVDSNVTGVQNLLEVIRNKNRRKMPILLHFSTDEVYGDIEQGSHKETDLLQPSNPYSATKASADNFITAWARTYDVPYIIIRPTNNYGIGQYTEKYLPRTIKYLTLGKLAELHDAGEPKRCWLHATDTANAVITIIKSGVKNEIFNVSGNHEDKNINIAYKIINIMGLLGDPEQYLDLSVTRPGQDVRYAVDDTKLKELGWEPKADFDAELERIVSYYSLNFIW